MKEIKLTWLGHSCFKIEEDGFVVILDPMKDGSVPGVRPVREKADLVLCSHGHGDHNAAELIDVSEAKAESPFRIWPMSSYHDDAKGTKRGLNTIHMLDDGTLRVAHMGDIGCIPEEIVIRALKGVDLLLMPVGGHYTLSPADAAKLTEMIAPKVVIPMHYRTDHFGFDVIAEPEEFLSFRNDVVHYDGPEFILTPETRPQTAVLTYK
ncbi:MAG: MBL fold metallo-hydrolase [Lachnospiraceae bacterium]|nr:MBL fold metallo-hydrolase [Lachnospiraceae bacterium]